MQLFTLQRTFFAIHNESAYIQIDLLITVDNIVMVHQACWLLLQKKKIFKKISSNFTKIITTTYTVELLVGALQTLLGLLGLHQILQTFTKIDRVRGGEEGQMTE